jgi:quercetin dioxygenase-like cupin family protein
MKHKIKVSPKWTRLVCNSAVIAFTALYGVANTGRVWATPAAGFTTTTTMSGRFDEIDVRNKPLIPDSSEIDRRAKAWLALEKAPGSSHLYIQSNVWQAGGNTGWHTHPGHSLIIVTAGTVTEYEALDLDCKPHVYTEGMSFMDPHHDHAHIVRNEGDSVARTIAIQLIPAGEERRIDSADPGTCHF